MEVSTFSKPFPFFKLPVELRQQIYAFAIGNLEPSRPSYSSQSITSCEDVLGDNPPYEVGRAATRELQKDLHNLFNNCRQIRFETCYLLDPRCSKLLIKLIPQGSKLSCYKSINVQ